MAVARRSSNTLAYSGGRTSTVIPAPASIVNGDVLIAIIHAGNGATTPVTITPPTGWTEITGSPAFLAKSDPYVISNHVFRKVASGESGSYTFTHASADTEALIYSLSGADTAAAVISSHDSGVGTTTTIPGITTTVDGSFVFMSESNWDGTAGEVPPTGTTPTFTQRLAGTLMYVSDGVMSPAGATGAKSHTNGNLSNQPWVGWLVAVPATSGGGGVTGSLAATESGSDTASFSGSVKATGTLAATETGSDTASFSGSVKASGALAATETGSDTASFVGTFAAVGVLSATETGNDTASFSGSYSIPGAAGVLAAIEAGQDAASFTGQVTFPDVTGALAAIETGQDFASFALVAPVYVVPLPIGPLKGGTASRSIVGRSPPSTLRRI